MHTKNEMGVEFKRVQLRMTTEEAVLYLEHGPGIAIDLKGICEYLSEVFTKERGYEAACMTVESQLLTLLAKLEGK